MAEAWSVDMEGAEWQKRSIYKVPKYVVNINNNEAAYMPQAVSFGPYHHEQGNMEDHKQRALRHLLHRSNKTLQNYVDTLNKDVQKLMDAYDSLDPKWKKDQTGFLELMVRDGCFMLEVLHAANHFSSPPNSKPSSTTIPNPNTNTIPNPNSNTKLEYKDYDSKDPIFSRHGYLHVMHHIRRDMLKLENQLPMLLLKSLVSLAYQVTDLVKQDPVKHLNYLILNFYDVNTTPTSGEDMGERLHVLDLHRQRLLSGLPQKDGKTYSSTANIIVRSATQLEEAGISFKPNVANNSLWNISFRGGVLKLPVIVVDDIMESKFLNLMAFERLHVGAGNEVTSYILFMDKIIDSPKDVNLLHYSGIIQSEIGSEKAVANLFNKLSTDLTPDPASSLEEVHQHINNYCKNWWRECRTKFSHTYLRSPWAFISLIAAILLMILTITQTLYTIMPYYKDEPSRPAPPFTDIFHSSMGPPVPTQFPH